MKKLMTNLAWLALGLVIGSDLKAPLDKHGALVILFAVMCIAIWNLKEWWKNEAP